jgi:hypothetical protein
VRHNSFTDVDQVADKVSEFANESMVLRNESKKILKEVQKHVAKNKKMIMAGENVVPNDMVKKMVDGWTVIQNEWSALETVCFRKMEAFQTTHGSLEQLTQSVENHQREFIKYAEQMRIDIGSADKFVEEVLPTVLRAMELHTEFSKMESTVPTIHKVIQEDDEKRRAVMQQCADYRTQVESVLANAKNEVVGTVQQEIESTVTEITATCNLETLKCIGAWQKCESILPEIEAAIERLTQLEELRLEQRVGDLERVPAIQVLPPDEPTLFSDEERVQELVALALMNERGDTMDTRQWYIDEFRTLFQEQTNEQASTIDQCIRGAKEMMILMYNKIKESLRAATRGNIQRMEEIVDIAMNLVKGSENYQVATETLLRGLSELQNRESGDDLYIQAESTVMETPPDINELEVELERAQSDVPVCVLMQNDGDQNDGVAGDGQGDQNNDQPNDDQEQREQSSQQSLRSDQGSQNSNRSRGNRGPRQTRNASHPFSGNLFGCFLTVRGRPNVAWTRSEYERLTRNGYNLARVYDTFEEAMAWLRQNRLRYRLNNPDAADADWSTSDEDEDPDDPSPHQARRDNQEGGSNRRNRNESGQPQPNRDEQQSDQNNQQSQEERPESERININQQPCSNGTQNIQSNQSMNSPFQPFDVRSQEFQSNARERSRQSRGYDNRRQRQEVDAQQERSQQEAEDEQDDDPHQWMLEFNVTPTGMWENGWIHIINRALMSVCVC